MRKIESEYVFGTINVIFLIAFIALLIFGRDVVPREKVGGTIKAFEDIQQIHFYTVDEAERIGGYKIPRPLSDRYINQLTHIAIDHEIPLYIFYRCVYTESGWNELVSNESGALGLMGIIPSCCGMFNPEQEDWWEPEVNVRTGCRVLRYHYKETGSWHKALDRYVGGAEVYVKQVMGKYYKNQDHE